MVIDGINIIGDLTSQRGLTEAARSTINAMYEQGYKISLLEHNYSYFPEDQRDADYGFPILSRENIFPVNLIFYGIAGFHHVTPEQLQQLTANKYTISYWAWEFMSMPEEYREQFARVNEVWTCSTFCQECMAQMTTNPVRVVPHPIALKPFAPGTNQLERGQFGIPQDRFTFMFVFDATGSIARKNPEGVIQAFEKAFGGTKTTNPNNSQRPLLVIRARHIGAQPEYAQTLRAAVERVGGILLTENYSREQTDLLLNCADAYVSLHRAEGFGLTLAESMALGKPVIATNYSGNKDFMNAANSFPVDYNLRPVVDEDHPGQPFFHAMYNGRLWAEPDLDNAAEMMQIVFRNPNEAARQGAQAARDIETDFSPLAVGRRIKNYLLELKL